MRSPTKAVTTGASASDEKARQNSGNEAECGQHPALRCATSDRSLARARPPACAGGPEKVTPNALTKQAAASAAASRQEGPDRRNHELQSPCGQLRAQEDGLEGQPFGHEAVEGRQGRDGDTAHQEGEGGLRHAMNEAAEMLHVALARGGQHGAGAEEQQALEDGMIEHVEQPGGERERGGRRHAWASKARARPRPMK